MENQLRQKMYVLVAYNLSSIQKGVQAVHAVVRYQKMYGDTKEYKQWSEKDETLIILDGGTSNKSKDSEGHYKGLLDATLSYFTEKEINVVGFYEEDANDMLTAIAFLVDERVWDSNKHFDYFIKGFENQDFIKVHTIRSMIENKKLAI